MTKLKNNEKWAKWLLFHFTKERSEKRNVQNAMNCMTNIGNMFTITNMRKQSYTSKRTNNNKLSSCDKSNVLCWWNIISGPEIIGYWKKMRWSAYSWYPSLLAQKNNNNRTKTKWSILKKEFHSESYGSLCYNGANFGNKVPSEIKITDFQIIYKLFCQGLHISFIHQNINKFKGSFPNRSIWILKLRVKWSTPWIVKQSSSLSLNEGRQIKYLHTFYNGCTVPLYCLSISSYSLH